MIIMAKKEIKSSHIVIGVILVIAIVIGVASFTSPPKVAIASDEGTDVGKIVPKLSFKDTSGNDVSLSDFEGQNLIINAWAAWCPFCINEMTELQQASDAHDDVTVIFVHRTSTEAFSAGQRFLNDFENSGKAITDPIVLDSEDKFYSTFFGFGMPVTLFVDKEGVIKFKKTGPMNLEEINDKIDQFFRGESMDENTNVAGETEIKVLPDGTKYLVNPNRILSGGPPKGGIGVDIGISALAEGQAKFISVEDADYLSDDDLVLGLVFEGEVRAYPHEILVFHEIANDIINDKPIVVTYCPLCLTGIAFSREIPGLDTIPQFGTSGKLFNSNLVMYDDATDSYWYQQSGQAIVGELTGTRLKWIPIDTVTWGDWKKQHPDTKVLSRDTGFIRGYGSDPYGGYYTSNEVSFGATFTDTRLHPKTWVHGIIINDVAKAYTREGFPGLVNDNVGGIDILAVQDPDTQAIRFFERQLGGEILEFNIQDGKLLDNNGDEWGFDGLSGDKTLNRIPDNFGFWFSWTLANPGTELFQTE